MLQIFLAMLETDEEKERFEQFYYFIMATVNKRVVSALTVLLVIFGMTGVSFAGEYGVTPIYDYATEAICQLHISNGTASAYAKVRGNYGTVTKVSANMYEVKYI